MYPHCFCTTTNYYRSQVNKLLAIAHRVCVFMYCSFENTFDERRWLIWETQNEMLYACIRIDIQLQSVNLSF